ncbi:MAG: Bax inhibitor-1 family protein [Acidobacteriota bacterium]
MSASADREDAMQYDNPYAPPSVATAGVDARAAFITRTYLHLFAAMLGFVAIEITFFVTGLAFPIANAMLKLGWLPILGAFMLASWIASRVAHTAESSALQYAALVGFVFAEALLFLPMLAIASVQAPGAITSAGLVTLMGFLALTMIAFFTRKDFSFLRGILMWGGIGALLLIVGGVIFGFQLGLFFSVAMVVFAGAAVLYDTSNVLHHYREDQHVGAALQLFASIALMLWYVLRIFMASRD